MIRVIRGFLVALTVCIPVSAQIYLDLYTNLSTDGTYVYATGTMQYSPGPNCSMCAAAYHTYQEAGQLTSPSGNKSFCNNSWDGSAETSINLQCATELPLDDDYGDYVMTFSPRAACSIVGVILSAALFPVINVKVTTSYFGPNLPGAIGFCNYPTAACTGGTTPTCGPPHLTVFSYPNCNTYIRSSFLVVNGSCTPSLDFPAGGGGPCT